MRRGEVFAGGQYKEIEARIAALLNDRPGMLSADTRGSPRAVGDAVRKILSEELRSILGDLCGEYSAGFARRAMADIEFKDREGVRYVVDVKTHRLDTAFNMPNLISVERLARLYERDDCYFVILVVNYRLAGMGIHVEAVHFVPIEFLSWDCLTIGALGWGQIQIANASKTVVDEYSSRKTWMIRLCEVLLQFYPREMRKLETRLEHFKKIKEAWRARPED